MSGPRVESGFDAAFQAVLAAPALRYGVLAAIGLMLLVLLVARRRRAPAFRVRPRPLMTDNEIEFHRRLEAAVPEWRVMAQVSMGALIEPDIKGGSGHYLSIRARYAQKVVDYVVLDEALSVVALVELDDRTHVAARDAERDAITAAAGYRTLRYQSRAKPDSAQIRRDLRSA
ncbi:MAG: DUF2726 domain-containing protein [Lautropia sp.]